MISSSQISLVSNSSRQTTFLDTSQLRIRQGAASPQGNGQQVAGTELSMVRQATYQYSSQEQMAFSNTSKVSGNGREASLASTELVEKSSELLLLGQQALNVSRAALGGGDGVGVKGEVAVTAGQYVFYSESESRNFASSGSISLENGETIDFTLSLRQSQSRTYEYSELVQIRERPMTDPLVINFGTSTAHLNDTLFEFDLEGNGKTGQYASLSSGSGYLVFDRNGNGKVDDGTELFGPQSGSGFGELAHYDDDGNGWIDANDEIFQSLSVWVQTAEGGEELRSLEEVGVRALYVDSVEDRFTLTNGQGVPLGQIKAAGIYLTTDGEVRTLEELDLAEQNTKQAPMASTPLETGQGNGPSGSGQAGNERADARLEAIQQALVKLNEIRAKQQAFIERAKEDTEKKSPLEDYFHIIDRLRLELLNSQDEKKQAASRYLEFASL